MAIHDDFLLRQIEDMARVLGLALFHKADPALIIFDEEGNVSKSGLLYHRLKRFVSDGKIGEAEDLLFDMLEDSPTRDNLQVAYQFYADLQEMPDDALEHADFTRQEILDGMQDIKLLYEKTENAE